MIDSSIYRSLRNIPISGAELGTLIGETQLGKRYCSPRNKLVEMEKRGEIIRLKKGLYVLNASDFGFPPSAPICSNHIYGPSYLSRQWALSFYGLIPERVNEYTAMTIKRGKNFENDLGRFTYYHVESTYFPIGLTNATIDGASCLLAGPQKALVDLILADKRVPSDSMRALAAYLEEDIRLDMDALKDMDETVFQQCATCGHKSSTILNLIKLLHTL